jgi:hypothetical protein
MNETTWKEPVKLPPLSKLRSRREKHDPYDKLYGLVAKQAFSEELVKLLYPEANILELLSKKINLSVSDFWVCEEDYKKLRKLTEDWATVVLKKKYGFKPSKKMIQKELCWFDLDRSPAVFYKKDRPEWAKPGYVYVREPKNEQKI